MSPAEAAEYGLIDRVLEGPVTNGAKPADSVTIEKGPKVQTDESED
jgi:hypothetical protein